jgi:hypothetical protein
VGFNFVHWVTDIPVSSTSWLALSLRHYQSTLIPHKFFEALHLLQPSSQRAR